MAIIAGLTAVMFPMAARAQVGSWQIIDVPWEDDWIYTIHASDNGGVLFLTESGLWRMDEDTFTRDRLFDPIHLESVHGATFVPGTEEMWLSRNAELLHVVDGQVERYPIRDIHATGLAFSLPDNGWVGGMFAYLYHWDGTSWNPISDPAFPHDQPGTGIAAIEVVSPNEAWFFGYGLEPVHFQDGEFSRLPQLSDVTGGNRYAQSPTLCALPNEEIVLAGSRSGVFDGELFHEIEGAERMVVCATDPAGAVWLGGADGRIARWEAGVLEMMTLPVFDNITGLVFNNEGRGIATAGRTVLGSVEEEVDVFRDRGPDAGVNDAGYGVLAQFLPLNDDPYADLLLVNNPGHIRLFRNMGDWSFLDVTEASGIPQTSWTSLRMAVCDLDNDGNVDLFGRANLPDGERLPIYLRGTGDGRFEDVRQIQAWWPEELDALVNDIDCVDLDADGDLDIYVTRLMESDSRPARNIIFENTGHGALRLRIPAARGLGGGDHWNVFSQFVDLSGDGFPELFLANVWNHGPTVFERDADRGWHEANARWGIGRFYSAAGAVEHGDLDLDGDFDVVVLEGVSSRIYRNDRTWLTQRPFGEEGSISFPTPSDHSEIGFSLTDIDTDGDIDMAVLHSNLGVRLFRNEGRLQFTEITSEAGLEIVGARYLTVGDVDADGDVDFYVTRAGEPNLLLENTGAGTNRVVRIRSVRASAAGAEVTLHAQTGEQLARYQVPQDGGPLSLPPVAGDGEFLKIRLTDGSETTHQAPTSPYTSIVIETGLDRTTATASAELRRRITWFNRLEEGSRAAAFLLVMVLLVVIGCRRRTRWFGGIVVPLGLMILFVTSALIASTASTLVRWTIGGSWFVVVPLLALLDHRLTALRNATRIGHFRLERRLGTGGMGSVHLARDTLRGQMVALKLLHPELMVDSESRERFRREAQLGAQIKHDNLVKVIEYGECEIFQSGRPEITCFLSMEYVDGKNLRMWFNRHAPLPLGQACRIVVDLCSALNAIHSAGIIHRDVKPENIMLSNRGVLKLTDFGLARGVGLTTLTVTQAFMGTLTYMAPEQAKSSRVDARADLYSVGVIAYEMLSGRLPFVGDEPLRLMYQILNEEPPPLSSLRDALPKPLAIAVHCALAKDPDERFVDVSEFQNAFSPYADPRVELRSIRTGRSKGVAAATPNSVGKLDSTAADLKLVEISHADTLADSQMNEAGFGETDGPTGRDE